MALRINRSLRLPDKEYKREVTKKNLIVLHHTAGGSARSTYQWWLTDPKPIGTAYIVARDGRIHEVFDPKYWAYHLGYSVRKDERRSIGIELACEGALLERGGELYCYDKVSERTRYRGVAPWCIPHPWRGYRWFAPYPDKQVVATIKLVKYLLGKFQIPPTVPKSVAMHKPIVYRASNRLLTGVLSHAHVRADKTDVHPGFPWRWFAREVGLHLM